MGGCSEAAPPDFLGNQLHQPLQIGVSLPFEIAPHVLDVGEYLRIGDVLIERS